MGQEIQFTDGGRIFYATFPEKLRRYNFEYITFHGVKYEHYYDVYFVNVEQKNKFKVESFNEEATYFDTYDEAEAYIFKQIYELKSRIQADEKEIKAFIEKKNKRKRGSKESA